LRQKSPHGLRLGRFRHGRTDALHAGVLFLRGLAIGVVGAEQNQRDVRGVALRPAGPAKLQLKTGINGPALCTLAAAQPPPINRVPRDVISVPAEWGNNADVIIQSSSDLSNWDSAVAVAGAACATRDTLDKTPPRPEIGTRRLHRAWFSISSC
jgi:hypothetical protein